MPNWKKVITSGSNAHLNQITASSADFNDGHIRNVGQIDADELRADADSNVVVQLSTNGINFDVNNGDSFVFNGNESTADLDYKDTSGDSIFFIDESLKSTTIGIQEENAKSTLHVVGDITVKSNGHITASGNISASGTSHTFGGQGDFKGGITGSSLLINGNISASGDVFANQYYTDGVLALDLNPSTNTTRVGTNNSSTGILLGKAGTNTKVTMIGNVTASGNISSSGVITATRYDIGGSGKFAVAGDGAFDIGQGGGASLNLTNITASGNISCSGDITASNILLDGNLVIPHTGNIYLNGSDTGDRIEANGGSQIDIRVNNSQAAVFRQAKVGIPGYHAGNEKLNVQGVASASSFVSNTHITASGNISASSTSTGSFGTLHLEGTNFSSASLAAAIAGGGGSADNLGNHTATQDLDLDDNSIKDALHITASGKILSSDEIILDDNGGDTLVRAYASNDDGIIDIYQNNNVTTRIAGNGTSFFKDNEGVLIGPGTNIAATAVGGNVTSLTVEGHISSSGDTYFGNASGDIHRFIGHITASGIISASGAITSSGINIVGSGTAELEVDGHITASGNISSSEYVYAERFIASGQVRVGGVTAITYSDPEIRFGYHTNLPIQIGKTITSRTNFAGNITASGNISASGTIISNELETQYRHFDTGSNVLGSAGGSMGDIVRFGGTTTVAGKIYYLKTDGTWAVTDADNGGESTGSIAVAVGTNSTTNGMLLRGTVNLGHDPGGAIGAPLYLSTDAGSASSAVPSGNGDIARVIGYNLDTSGKIYFNPDNTFVEVSA